MKKSFRVDPVLFVTVLLPLVVVAQFEDCFCHDGASVPDPEKQISLSPTVQITCGSLEEEAADPFLVMTFGCNYYQYYAHLCECEESELQEPIQTCTFCRDSQERDFRKTVEYKANEKCQQYDEEAKFDPFLLGCGYYNYRGSLCGCAKNRPPFGGCTICANGQDPPFASREVWMNGFGRGTCQEANTYSAYVYAPGTPGCDASQATLGTYCGCESSSDDDSAAASEFSRGGCNLCTEEGMSLSNVIAPEFNYLNLNGKTRMYQSGASCLEAELIARGMSETREEVCESIREQLSEFCCTNATSWEPEGQVVDSKSDDIEPDSMTEQSSEARLIDSAGTTIQFSALLCATLNFVWLLLW